jgi:hypothetical protein
MVSAVAASPTLLLGLVVGYQRLRRTRRRLSAQRDLGNSAIDGATISDRHPAGD